MSSTKVKRIKSISPKTGTPDINVLSSRVASSLQSPRSSISRSIASSDDEKDDDNQNQNGYHPTRGKQKAFEVEDCLKMLVKFVKKHNLDHIICADGGDLEENLRPRAEIAAELPKKLKYVSRELAMPLAILSLYDMAVLIDDSSSMEFDEAGVRIETLKDVLLVLAEIYGAVSNQKRGIRAIRFLNGWDDIEADNIKTREEIDAVIGDHAFEGLTRIGTALMQKILKPFIFKDGEKWDKINKTARTLRDLERPVLIMVITDGAVEGEPPTRLRQAIQSVVDALKADSRFAGQDRNKAVVFQFARVGNDEDAQKFLWHLDNKSTVKDYVDTMSGKDLMEILGKGREGKAVKVNDQRRLLKLLLGPIIEDYDQLNDSNDEASDSADDFDDDEDEEEGDEEDE